MTQSDLQAVYDKIFAETKETELRIMEGSIDPQDDAFYRGKFKALKLAIAYVTEVYQGVETT